MIDELEVEKYDAMFGTRSKIFFDTIIIDSGIDEWQIRIINKHRKGVCLLHRNKYGRTNKFHTQGFKSNIFQGYDSIYRHKNVLSCVKNKNIDKKEILNAEKI